LSFHRNYFFFLVPPYIIFCAVDVLLSGTFLLFVFVLTPVDLDFSAQEGAVDFAVLVLPAICLVFKLLFNIYKDLGADLTVSS